MISRFARERLRGIRSPQATLRLPEYSLAPGNSSVSGPRNVPIASPRVGLADGREVITPLGAYWHHDIPLAHLWPGLTEAIRRFVPWPINRSDQTESSARKRKSPSQELEVLDFSRSFPQQVIFLDLETCGFMGAPIFLAGIVRWEARTQDSLSSKTGDGAFHLTQLWARDYSEEPALLWALHHMFLEAKVLVTFNGKSFDWPQVVDRSTRHASVFRLPRPDWRHWDLLHASRRSFKHDLPNCRLQTLEQRICGRYRTADLPSHMVPSVYASYVRCQDHALVDSILHHNALDLVTVVDLALRLGRSPEEYSVACRWAPES